MTRRTRLLSGAAVLGAVAIAGGALALSGADRATGDDDAAPASTAEVRHGRLSAVVSHMGILTHRARPDGSPYAVVNHARGVYTELPAIGEEVRCGEPLYRVDQRPVLLLCGAVPAYRALGAGDAGRDVRQLNRTLHERGLDARAGVDVDPAADDFTDATEAALELLQRRTGASVTGALALGDAVFLPGPVRIARVGGELGAPARPGDRSLGATSGALHVQVDIDPSEQGQVRLGDRAQVTLPGNRTATGRVAGFGRIAQAPAAQDDAPAETTIPTSIRLDDPRAARGLDGAPVQVDIVTAGVEDALSVPVTALVGHAGGGFAVEAVRAGGHRELVAVRLGLFDTAAGRVQVEGALRAGDRVVVPAS